MEVGYAAGMVDIPAARDLAYRLLADALPRRWAHTRGVAAQAEAVARAVGADGELLVSAAWLHDIGYAPDLVDTGFHPLDGARYLRDQVAAGQRLCRLVGNHSCALIEARRRGLAETLAAEFPAEESLVADALTYSDMSTSPDGEPVTPEQRLREIVDRYGEGHLVSESMTEAHPHVQRAAAAVRHALAQQPVGE